MTKADLETKVKQLEAKVEMLESKPVEFVDKVYGFQELKNMLAEHITKRHHLRLLKKF